ncbi:MAG TPA: DUF2332 domain-containing protein, partial [Acidimicrobiales bacterium]
AVAADADKLAGVFAWLADNEFPGYSPLYEHLARHIARERWIPAFVSRHNRSPFAGVLFLDCVRELTMVQPSLTLARHYESVVAGGDPLQPDPWPLFREVVLTHHQHLADQLRHRAIQTNEVGRSAALLPAFALVAQRFERPLALIEIGASAGLNLFFDRFHIDYGTAGQAGPADATVRLHCEVRGPLLPPVPTRSPDVVSRLGIDLSPVDVTDPDAARWLEACLWPDVPHRVERFRAALELARADPPELWAGNAVDLVARAVEAVPPGAVACLDATWVLAYFSEAERDQLHATLDHLGAERTIAFVTAEYEGNTPWVPEPTRPASAADHSSPTLLGLGLWDHGRTDHAALAWVQPHLRWIEWINPATAG